MEKINYEQFSEKIFAIASKEKKLIYATIELTDQCNFSCKHCYLGDKGNVVFLDVDFVKETLMELKERGCLCLIITGGEPLMHPHFKEIYIYAKKLGFIITVFTNAYLLTEDVVEMFVKYKPLMIEVSIYGVDEDSYVNLTQCKGAYDKVINNIKLLKENNIFTRLKTMLLKQTSQYIPQMYELADSYGMEFRWDYYIVQTLDGETNVESTCLLSEEEIVEHIMKDPAKLELFEEAIASEEPQNDLLYKCNAGLTNVYISAKGELSICAIAREPKYDLINGSLDDGLNFVRDVGLMKMPKHLECSSCDKITFCGYCPSKFNLETGDYYKPITKYCNIARLVLKKLSEKGKVEISNE